MYSVLQLITVLYSRFSPVRNKTTILANVRNGGDSYKKKRNVLAQSELDEHRGELFNEYTGF